MQDDQSIDFLKKKYNLAPKRSAVKKNKTALRIAGAFLALMAFTGIGFSYQIAKNAPGESNDSSGFSLFSSFKKLVTAGEKELTGEDDDRINFLLLGVGGAGHEGPELTDTIIFGSFRPSDSEVGLLSIPRDLIVPIPGYGYRKINSVNVYGELKEPGQGIIDTANLVGELLDQKIHYTIKVDFKGFEELIDAVGGVDVTVERSFSDYTYPTDDYLVQTITFQQGRTHMDGSTALQYARSRHGTNGEGSDFARAKRQQNLIIAVKEKVLSPSVLLNPGKLNKIVQTFQNNVETNLTFWEMTKLARFAPEVDTDNIHHTVLDSSPSSPLYATTINGAYVLMPKRDDWSQVKTLALNIFSGELNETTLDDAPIIAFSTAKIEIQNGTSTTGLAFQTSQMLVGSGFDVIKIGNAESKGYKKTIIYDLTEGRKSEELATLKDFLEADVAMSATGWIFAGEVVPRELSVATPGENQKTSSDPIDFLVILGESAESLVLR